MSKLPKFAFVAALALAFLVQLSVMSCKKEEKKQGGGQKPVETDPPSDNGGGAGGGDETVSGGTAKTLKQCNDNDEAWIAVVNGGKSPSTCGDKLANWGCCKASVLSRFKTLASALSERVDSNLDADYQLYNCSVGGERSYKMHFARFPGGGKVEYREITIDAFAYEPEQEVDCPKLPNVDFPDINDLINTDGGDGGDDPEASETDGPDQSPDLNLTFADDINPIMITDCAGAGCHGKSGAGSFVLVDNEANFEQNAAAIKAAINKTPGSAGAMPPGQALSTQDKKVIEEFSDSI